MRRGSTRSLPAPPICWVGPNHLLVKSPYTGPLLFDIASGATQAVNTLADWTVGAIPGGL